MSTWRIYQEMSKERERQVKSKIKEAQNLLSKYSHTWDDEVLYRALDRICAKNMLAMSNYSQWPKVLNEQTLCEAILFCHLRKIKTQIETQKMWLDFNDAPIADANKIRLRKEFLNQLEAILLRKYEGKTIEEQLKFRFKQSQDLSDKITSTPLEELKDHSTFGLIQKISMLLKLCCMFLTGGLYTNRVIYNKCALGSPFSTLWSGKTLNDIQVDHLKIRMTALEQIHTVLAPEEQENYNSPGL